MDSELLAAAFLPASWRTPLLAGTTFLMWWLGASYLPHHPHLFDPMNLGALQLLAFAWAVPLAASTLFLVWSYYFERHARWVRICTAQRLGL